MSFGQFGLPFTVCKSYIRYYLWSKYYGCESYLENDLGSVFTYVTWLHTDLKNIITDFVRILGGLKGERIANPFFP